jgi:hypothetical protein
MPRSMITRFWMRFADYPDQGQVLPAFLLRPQAPLLPGVDSSLHQTRPHPLETQWQDVALLR